MKANKNRRLSKPLIRLGWIILLLFLWEFSVKVFKISPLLFPPVESVLQTLWTSFIRGDLGFQALYSFGFILVGLTISAVLAILLIWIAFRWPVAGSFIDTVTAIAHPLPGLALLPLLIIWFSAGSGSVLAIVVHSALWPILLNLFSGFNAVPQIYIDAARNLSMRKSDIILSVMFKSALGYFISGLKIGWARAWRALISAEMVFGAIGAKGGIGWYILKQRTFMNTAGLFAGIIIVVVLGILVEDLFFNWLEKVTIRRWGMSAANDKE